MTFVTGKNVLLFGGVVAISATVRAVFSTFFAKPLGLRLLPILPVLLGVVGTLFGIADGLETLAIPERILLGAVVGFAAGHSYKIGKTTISGSGVNSTQAQPLNEDK